MRRRTLPLVLVATAVAVTACSSGSGTAGPTPGSTSASPGPDSTAASASASAVATTVTTAPGDSVPSIPGAPTQAQLLAEGRSLLSAPLQTDPTTLANGTSVVSIASYDPGENQIGLDVYTAVGSGNLAQLNCGSKAPADAPDALRDVCLDIARPGADREAAAAWVAESLAALPPGADVNSAGISNLDLSGLEWKVYRGALSATGTDDGYLWVTVAAKGLPLQGVTGS